MRSPANMKVDGELKEWTNKNLSAYNLANRIFYVVSNDDIYLYLTVRGSGSAAGLKILKEGITFTISHHIEKDKRTKDPQNVSVTFPTSQNGMTVSSIMYAPTLVLRYVKDTLKYRKEIDSLTAATNVRVEKIAKEIKVVGIKDISDPTISVYNDKDIKAAIHFWRGEPVVEFAIPLIFLDLTSANPVTFSYNIKLNVPRLNGDFAIPQKSGVDYGPTGISPDDSYRFTETELWGEYTLAKKK
ncbi:hypothetical protein [Mucilaginibacter boryungensis]